MFCSLRIRVAKKSRIRNKLATIIYEHFSTASAINIVPRYQGYCTSKQTGFMFNDIKISKNNVDMMENFNTFFSLIFLKNGNYNRSRGPTSPLTSTLF